MLTQISLMPTSCRCFGNPSSIVPSKAVCTKHRSSVYPANTARHVAPSSWSPFVPRSRDSRAPPFTDLRNGLSRMLWLPLSFPFLLVASVARRSFPWMDTVSSLPFTAQRLYHHISLSLYLFVSVWTSRRARRVVVNTRACVCYVLIASVLFARVVALSGEMILPWSTSDWIKMNENKRYNMYRNC